MKDLNLLFLFFEAKFSHISFLDCEPFVDGLPKLGPLRVGRNFGLLPDDGLGESRNVGDVGSA